MNFIEGRTQRENGTLSFVAEGVRIELPAARAASGATPTTVGVRPEDLRIRTDGSGSGAAAMSGRVVLVERLGGTSHIHFDVGAQRFLALVGGDPLPDVGDVVGVDVLPERVHLFDANGGAV